MNANWISAVVAGVALVLFLGISGCEPSASKAATENPAGTTRPVAVVELFTSEGCSSCPPADDAITDLAADVARDGRLVYPISFHVDYWNRLGWSDRFSSSAYSDRQRKYGDVFGDRSVYTPQAVVNGKVGFVGSDRGRLKTEIAAALKSPAVSAVELTAKLDADGKHLSVDYKVTGAPAGSVLNLVAVERDLKTDVAAGENTGRTLKHTNVARAFESRSLAADSTGHVTLTLPDGMDMKNVTVVGFVQDGKTMAVSGASAAQIAR